ncbi:hypothetical protein [Aliikangiella coralliicola]|uniref:DUF4124 domain-containing protein n=1 Tax=Aliikangiella coralliicola TaxID=2592383 RepID=A0A545UHN7_9GAMM|nr:hypothetical protein [Aliikangiella coralliicola]TQV88968.1 hypothetical protein FLL46_05405 [Aliikangiella coralliicola]
MRNVNLLILLFVLALFSFEGMAKQFYRYKNSDGALIIKDQLTNEMIAVGYDILNDSGRVIKRVGPGKTLAEEEQERLSKIEQKKAEIQLQQKIRSDAELLRQFSSIGDIIRNRDAQLLALEQRIKIQESKSDLLKLQLEDQQKQAATHERLGQNLPKLLQNDILATRQQLVRNEQNSNLLEDEKIKVASRYEKDIVRYKELESLRKTLKKDAKENDGSQPVIYDCPDPRVCQRAWQLAQVYAKDNASGQIEIITNTLILTSKPEKDTEIALSFSRIPAPNNGNQIVLEVSCNNTEQGVNLCKSNQVKKVRTSYLSFLKERLN